MKKRRFTTVVFTLLVLVMALTGCKKKSVEPHSIRIAIQPSAAFIPLYVARYSGVIEAALAPKKVSVIWQDFESGPPMVESLSADLTDIAVIGDVPTVLALAGSTRMKLVGIPASGPNAYAMIARKDNDSFNTCADLKGKRVATVFGSTGHNFTKKLLEKSGLSFSDIEFTNISAETAEDVLSSGYADAVVIWEPNITRLVDKGVAKIVAQGDETSLRGTNGFVVREEFLVTDKEAISIVLETFSRAAKSLNSLNVETTSNLASALNVTPEQVKKIARKYNYTVDIAEDDVAALNDTIKFLVSIGNLENEYSVEKFVDKSCFSGSKVNHRSLGSQ